MAQSAKMLASQQDYMPFRDTYISTFKNDIEYSQLLLQTATALQTNKFIQVGLTRYNTFLQVGLTRYNTFLQVE
uniref:Uncharacterized protein n=1 Tax=Hucho hucho TaxID=62062 RepID=A0A4W5LS58_9TELE